MKPDEARNEDLYGFGQVVALALLISPLVANADTWYGKCYSLISMARKDANLYRRRKGVLESAQESSRPYTNICPKLTNRGAGTKITE